MALPFTTRTPTMAYQRMARPASQTAPEVVSPPARERPVTKQTQLILLLQREGGASIAELTAALGWLPHTTRAALTGLRKKGHMVVRTKTDDVTRYSIASGDAA